MTGGHYDVDVIIQDPAKQIIYKEVKKQVRIRQKSFDPCHGELFCSTSLVHAPTGFADSCFVLDGFVWLPLFNDWAVVLGKSRECWELNPGLLGENPKCYLCAMPPPNFISRNLFRSTNNIFPIGRFFSNFILKFFSFLARFHFCQVIDLLIRQE